MLDELGLAGQLAELGFDTALRTTSLDGAAESPYPSELALVARAVEARRLEFVAGRNLARAALGDLGVASCAIGRRPDRSPDWPAGVIGSISHTQGLAVAVVARPRLPPSIPDAPSALVGLGVDVEVDQPLDPGVADRVLGSIERRALGATLSLDAVVVFSAKESVFKALNPLTGRWLEPEDVTVSLHADGDGGASGAAGPGSGSFRAALNRSGAGRHDPDVVDGRFVRHGRWVVTACVARTAGPVE